VETGNRRGTVLSDFPVDLDTNQMKAFIDLMINMGLNPNQGLLGHEKPKSSHAYIQHSLQKKHIYGDFTVLSLFQFRPGTKARDSRV
jgi:hypothetical protein